MGQVTASGIWFPDDSDPSDLKTLLATQASSIEDAIAGTVTDSGWISLPTNSGFAPQGGTSPQIRKKGNEVKMRWGWSNKGMTTAQSYIVSTIPSGFRPAQTLYGTLTGNAAWRPGRGIIWSSGDVEITTSNDLSGYYLFGNYNWTVD